MEKVVSNKIIRRLILACEIAILAIVLCGILYASYYSVLSADDFGFICIARDNYGKGFYQRLSFSWESMIWFNRYWQGAYFTNFVVYFFATYLCENNIYFVLRVITCGSTLLLFIAIVLFVRNFLRYVININSFIVQLAFSDIILLLFTSYVYYEEVFDWYVGACAYTIPVACALLSLVSIIKSEYCDDVRFLILALLLTVAANGGSLAIAGFVCYSYLMFTVFKPSKKTLIIFLESVGWALFNVMQPGNMVRGGVTGASNFPIKNAIENTIAMVKDRIKVFTGFHSMHTNIIFWLLIIMLLAYYALGKRYISKKIILLMLITPLLPFIVAFPIALGNNRYLMSNRYMFAIDLPLILVICIFFSFAGVLIRNFFIVEKHHLFIIAIICALLVMFDGYSLSDTVICKVYRQAMTGKYKEYYEECINLFNSLESKTGNIIVTFEEYPKGIDYMKPFTIDSDPTDWINESVAEYFGLDSISLEE